MPVDSPQYRMADRLTEGRLDEIIKTERVAGRSYEEIGRRLFAEFGIEAHGQTLRRWAKALGIEAILKTQEPAA